MFSNILGYKVFNQSKNKLIELVFAKKKICIISGNPEVLLNGMSNKDLFDRFNSDDFIIIPDGVGTVVSAKIAGQPVQEKIAGIEVMDELLNLSNEKGYKVYLLGASEDIIQRCKSNIINKYKNIDICGCRNGYFKVDEMNEIVEDIKVSKANILFVALGSPKQENFIIENMSQLPCNIYMPVGGSFDVFAGKVNRAPKIMIKLGLEWLYRVWKEPFRIKRLGKIPKFIFIVFLNRIGLFKKAESK
ncbi:WecB/TagA/CpsF family glycosyltransferase [Clostridium folliculivorans]|uniref:N-acetylglucosaminyldiphosphoundecaprenol N-acetyl-beta-D-mannosaminyltransferase n=1 Tax=Clostridium folliculivorans TaxID=2886038 RepID=A0A9W5XZL5_9CLOT|nr:WecB/TagA/CpsF family glycosyltransferase [Clostridium folliculivorans]GKU23946.1 UDP-N-acetyl-D-mannosaminuronic acid transferase [Clostridium folliculivorans]GKU30061.1 UDP-N-acetyl-D-mannosaminuronic acid transferase [Clostridium folliculivorans]